MSLSPGWSSDTFVHASEIPAMQPGEMLRYDGRTWKNMTPSMPEFFRVVQWNIERGCQFDGIIRTLSELDADFVILQEVDIHCKRTDYKNIPLMLATRLHALCVFVCEFQEIDDAVRGGDGTFAVGDGDGKNDRAYHGNVILSKNYGFESVSAIGHSVAVDWSKLGPRMWHPQPRRGDRVALRADVKLLPEQDSPVLHLYSLHLESCGMPTLRAQQLADVIADANAAARKDDLEHMFLIAGDLNTVAHGLARLSLGSFAVTQGFERILFPFEMESQWLWRCFLDPGARTVPRWKRILQLDALPFADPVNIDNRELQLYDPFNLKSDVTLDVARLKGFVQGKLDWLLLGGLDALRKSIGNEDYKLSDHKCLIADVKPRRGAFQQPAGQSHRYMLPFRIVFCALFLRSIVLRVLFAFFTSSFMFRCVQFAIVLVLLLRG